MPLSLSCTSRYARARLFVCERMFSVLGLRIHGYPDYEYDTTDSTAPKYQTSDRSEYNTDILQEQV